MRSPFPGMNPYLESPEFWSSLHSRMIVAIADAIAPALRPKYYVEVEKRVYLSRLSAAVEVEGGVLGASEGPFLLVTPLVRAHYVDPHGSGIRVALAAQVLVKPEDTGFDAFQAIVAGFKEVLRDKERI